ncbi:acyltransferase family protein [Brachybacterium sp. J144]|uniref:acyltransferase family protein n=1 Tax=Brachybacterium sp. J144 TaxID=3116487 RepID=UPI002E79063B|nr:acyltransferase family protein [Brachybacterium sp. J144]MEE1650844.1 acyltransferase family protein [Brachybacterium sp. J144]
MSAPVDPAPEPAPAGEAPPAGPIADPTPWLAAPLPSQTSTLDDWLQGPLESYAEREAEDAWSTAGSVAGTWRPQREQAAPAPDEDAAGTLPSDPSAATVPAGTQRRDRPAFRAELHGLRAVALGLVAVYHIWLGRVSGGVDVFLFLSAFFLTGTFVRRLESGRPLAIPRYWLHTFKRLLPPAAVTILLALAATAAFLPASLWPTVMQQAVASAVYLQNALLVLLQVDYQARDAGAASPLQHFWSLSVQGQAFVVWPLLFALVVRRARRGRPIRRPLLAIMALIGAASLTWSVLSTQSQQQVAYFDTAARLWEFAAGSMLALALPALDRWTGARRPEEERAPRLGALRALTGWAGIALLLATGIVLDVSSQFPGWIAMVPLAAAGAVVVAGHSGRRWGVDALLSTRPAAFVGDISYALYLVHWPILVVWLHHSGQERAGLLDGAAVLAGSVVLAWILTRAIDAPVRRSRWLEARPWRALTAIALSLALVLGASGGWWTWLNRQPEPVPAAQGQELPTDEVATEAPAVLRPAGWQLGGQWPSLPESCSGAWAPSVVFRNVHCEQLLPAGSEPAETIVVVGSSHSRQYIPALIPLAEERDAQIVNLSMDGCPFLAGAERDAYCAGYDEWVLSYLDSVDVDTVLATMTLTSADSAEEVLPTGADTAVQALLDRGLDVIVTRDTPRWPADQFQCAESVVDDGGTPADADAACGAEASAKFAAENPAAPLAALTGPDASVTLLDLSDQICPDGRCSPVLGDVYVYMDDDHLTRLFVEETLALAATERLTAAGF